VDSVAIAGSYLALAISIGISVANVAAWFCAGSGANSYGFRPGRSCHDAIEAIFNATAHLEKYVLDADVAKCFDRINHDALLDKLNTGPRLRRQIKAWLKAGVLDDGELFPTERGTMQGGTISPLLANVALHGMEELLVQRFPTKLHKGFYAPQVIRYADDLVVLHKDRAIIQQCQEALAEWLQNMGLELKPSKTRITHTRHAPVDEPGFSFLGFNIRQYAVGKTQSGKDTRRQRVGFKLFIKPSKSSIKRHIHQLGVTVGRHQHKEQTRLIRALNSLIIGWCRYYSTVVSRISSRKWIMFSSHDSSLGPSAAIRTRASGGLWTNTGVSPRVKVGVFNLPAVITSYTSTGALPFGDM
jgi:RNA-directed DNA polymerase